MFTAEPSQVGSRDVANVFLFLFVDRRRGRREAGVQSRFHFDEAQHLARTNVSAALVGEFVRMALTSTR